jgi:hypothetical protein
VGAVRVVVFVCIGAVLTIGTSASAQSPEGLDAGVPAEAPAAEPAPPPEAPPPPAPPKEASQEDKMMADARGAARSGRCDRAAGIGDLLRKLNAPY